MSECPDCKIDMTYIEKYHDDFDSSIIYKCLECKVHWEAKFQSVFKSLERFEEDE